MMGAFNKNVCEPHTGLFQDIFPKSLHTRVISLNTKYIVAFKNPRDKLQFQCLARQIYPEKNI